MLILPLRFLAHSVSFITPWRGARAVEWGGLENRCALTRTVGSNPTLSANLLFIFITQAARKVSLAGGSLRDVQLLAGHKFLAMTQRYIEANTDAQQALVKLLKPGGGVYTGENGILT